MTNPAPFFPAAQAVLDAIYEIKDPMAEDGAVIAAALRAAADQVVPKRDMPRFESDAAQADWFVRDDVRDDLLRIAAELEGPNG